MDTPNPNFKIKVKYNSAYVVTGGVPLVDLTMETDEQGLSVRWKEGHRYPLQERYKLCRCGKSKEKPFCDDSHHDFPFDGTETASREPVITQAEHATTGPDLEMIDIPVLCS